MCIAILKKEGAEITDETLAECYLRNSDGCGFSYIDNDGAMQVKKTMDYDEFLADFRMAEQTCESPFLIHFRIATHGTVDEFNCHPFSIDEETSFIHNGIVPAMPTDARKSDTQMFNELFLQELPEGWRLNVAMKSMVEKFIGQSKLVWLNTDGSWDIFNESKGVWEGEVWFSNTSYKPWPKTTYYTKANTYKGRTGGGQGSGNKFPLVPKVGTTGQGKAFVPSDSALGATVKEEDVFDEGACGYGSDSSLLDLNNDFGECVNCACTEDLLEMVAHRSSTGLETYCLECEVKLLAMGFLCEHDEITMKTYVDENNADIIRANQSLL